MARFPALALASVAMASCGPKPGPAERPGVRGGLVPADVLSGIVMELAAADGPDARDRVADRLKRHGSYEVGWEKGEMVEGVLVTSCGIYNDEEFPGWTITGTRRKSRDGSISVASEYSHTVGPSRPAR